MSEVSETSKAVEEVKEKVVTIGGKEYPFKPIPKDPLFSLKVDKLSEGGRNPFTALLREYYEEDNYDFLVAVISIEDKKEAERVQELIFGLNMGKSSPY